MCNWFWPNDRLKKSLLDTRNTWPRFLPASGYSSHFVYGCVLCVCVCVLCVCVCIYILWEKMLPQCSLFIPRWKHQKTRCFLMLSGGIKMEHWAEMGKLHNNMWKRKVLSGKNIVKLISVLPAVVCIYARNICYSKKFYSSSYIF